MYNYNPYLPPRSNNITWVQGIEGAKAYQLMPGSNTILLDSENDGVFYIKVSDNVGMCSLRTFKYSEVTESKPEYITRAELEEALQNYGKQFIQSTKQNTQYNGKSNTEQPSVNTNTKRSQG